MTTLELHSVLQHINIVRSFKFAPHSQQLVIGTGQARVFIWTPTGSCVISLPSYMDVHQGLHVQKVRWNPRGLNLVLSDKAQGVLGFPSSELVGGCYYKQMPGLVTSPRALLGDKVIY